MRILVILYILFLTACTQAVSQQPDANSKKDQEFYELLKQAKTAQATNRARIQAANEHTKQIVTKTVKNISTLKTTVETLKVNLNEANKKLDSVIDLNTGNPYKLLPIDKVSDH